MRPKTIDRERKMAEDKRIILDIFSWPDNGRCRVRHQPWIQIDRTGVRGHGYMSVQDARLRRFIIYSHETHREIARFANIDNLVRVWAAVD